MMTDAAERSAAARSRFVAGGATQAATGGMAVALQERVRPVTLTDEQRLPAAPALEAVLPGGGVRRGSVVGLEGPGSTSLLWSLLGPPTEAGSAASALASSRRRPSTASIFGSNLLNLIMPRSYFSMVW